jgi:hypothetical protein
MIDWLTAGTPIVVVLLTLCTFVFWLLCVYILLSVRGVKQKKIGCLRKMADGVGVIANGVGVIARLRQVVYYIR